MNKNKAIQSVNEIKELMELSSKFISLSGLSGILVGIYSLVGSWFVLKDPSASLDKVILIALAVFLMSVVTAFLISLYKSRKSGQKLFNKLTYQLIWNFSVPLLAGGLFCLALIVHEYYSLTSCVMLLFYGLALVNVSKFTFSNVGWLGYSFLILGLLDCFFAGNEVLFWAIGFGVFHIVYGVLFYFLYERGK